MTTTISNINESTTVKELEVNSTVYDIVGKGILDQNTKTTKTEWIGTKAEYDALAEYSDYCTYYITDDLGISNEYDLGHLTEIINDFDIDTFKPQVDAVKNGAISDINQATSDSVEQIKNMGEVVNYTNISNCITEIPQDIKLELSSDGVLTLKGGSKVYKPNGVGVFDEFIINADKSFSDTDSSTYKALVFYDGSTAITICSLGECASGTSLPSSFSGVFYNTTTNKINFYTSGIKTGPDYYLPVGIVTMSGASGITSIDQVFNGFGYIGSTVFALPGVKGLIPNGRNADGTLKNITFQISSVVTANNPDVNQNKIMVVRSDGVVIQGNKWIESKTKPSFSENLNQYWYNPDTNRVFFYRSSTNSKFMDVALAVNFDVDTDKKVSSFYSKQTFYSVDRNDTEFIANQAMPNGRYINLTLGASGSTYTAPAAGWFYLMKNAGVSGAWISLENKTGKIVTNQAAPGNANSMANYIPAKSGDTVAVTYSATGTTSAFRFIYADGTKNSWLSNSGGSTSGGSTPAVE